MPTATSTVTKVAYSPSSPLKGAVTVKAASSPSPTPATASASTTTATLHTLYNRAARAFLLRDIPLTYSLIESAFGVIQPPLSVPDPLAEHRRKWDILRITLESTVYSSPPPSNDSLPKLLQENQMKTPQALITSMHARSLSLFSPQKGVPSSNPAYLSSQVFITLIYSSLRVNCPDVGRLMIEEWLARRGDRDQWTSDMDAKENSYEKILELYCLQVLPRLEEWDYVREFLVYESELSSATRESFKASLKTLQDEATSYRQKASLSITPPSSEESSRSGSPSPSSSSSSSSLSTTSTSTIVPSTVRPSSRSRALTSSVSSRSSRASTSSDSTATPGPHQSALPVLRSRPTEPSLSSSSRFTSPPRSHSQAAALRPTNASIYALMKAYLTPYLTTSNISTFVVLFVVVPLISLLVRTRHRKQQALSGVANNADVARRRLQGNGASNAGVVGKAWTTVIRVVVDTIKMAGSGLV